MPVRDTAPDQSAAYAVRTSDGMLAVIKIELLPDEPDKIRIRYRLHRTSKPLE